MGRQQRHEGSLEVSVQVSGEMADSTRHALSGCRPPHRRLIAFRYVQSREGAHDASLRRGVGRCRRHPARFPAHRAGHKVTGTYRRPGNAGRAGAPGAEPIALRQQPTRVGRGIAGGS
jgi:hypothetical protein